MIGLTKYLKPYLASIIGAIFLVYVQVMTNLQLPDYMSRIVNEGIIFQKNDIILGIGFKMIMVSLLGALCTIGAGYLAARIGAGFAREMRNRVFIKVENFSLAEFNKFSTASLITRTTNDIQQIQMVIIILIRMVVAAPIMGVGSIIKAVGKSSSMSWILGVSVIFLLGMVLVLFKAAMPKFKLLQKLVDRLNLVTRENLTGLRVIKAFNAEGFEEEKFDKVNNDLTDTNLYVNRLMVIMHPLMMLILNITSIAIIWVGAHLIETGNLMIGDMMAFMQYTMQVIMSFLMLTMVFIMIPRAAVSAQRIVEVIETENVIMDVENPVMPGQAGGILEFKDVTFAYPQANSPVIKNISFQAEPGKVTAIIGSTGSGKTSLINLIFRFYDVTAGQILLDGLDIRHMRQDELRQRIGYIPQKAVLFSGTVESNIKYGLPGATDLEMERAAKTAQASEFIEKLENKYQTPIAQGGTNLSGGQKQRISIARALIKNPKIYIFDDSFSALDYKTDAALRKALAENIKEATVLIVAQRISTIMNADTIVVLEAGEIVGIGRHQALMKTCQVYQEIALSQLSEEELA